MNLVEAARGFFVQGTYRGTYRAVRFVVEENRHPSPHRGGELVARSASN
jgi:hypothetical protein